jgi:hypothetical protein
MKYKRHFMTFVEVMIILTIILLTTGLMGINIQRMIKQQHFKSEVAFIVDQLRLAQDIMLILNTDVVVRFHKEKEGYKLQLQVENILSKGWQREIKRDRPLLTKIKTVEFDDYASVGKIEEPPFDLLFLSGGTIMSQGRLRLKGSDEDLEVFIFFPGYPNPIESTQNKDQNLKGKFQHQTDYFEKLTFYMRREIEENLQKN